VIPIRVINRSKHWQQYIHTHPFNGRFLGLPRWAGTRKVKPHLNFTEARDSEWQWHQLGHMQVCISLQTDNHASTPPLKFFLQAGCPSCRPTNSVKALKADWQQYIRYTNVLNRAARFRCLKTGLNRVGARQINSDQIASCQLQQQWLKNSFQPWQQTRH